MKGSIFIDESLRDEVHVFDDRCDGGRRLAERLKRFRNTDALLFAIPAGGVPVASEMAKLLRLPMDIMLARKIQIPWNREAGFGAIGPEGEVIFNRALLNSLTWLTKDEIDEEVQKAESLLKERNRLFRDCKPYPAMEGKTIILADDGLASGYTMVAAVRFVKKKGARKIVVAVPTGNAKTVDFLLSDVDELICLNLRGGLTFAVADAYRHWADVSDGEVIAAMDECRARSAPADSQGQ